MPTYVPGHDQDVFISYAVLDDEPHGWVTCLVRHLQSGLAASLGRREAFSGWWDRKDLDEAAPLTSQIEGTLKKTALLVVILSPAYLKSRWCREERLTFLRAIEHQPLADRRVFLVDTGRLSEDERPAEFRDLLGFRFWEPDDKGIRRTLGHPVPDPRQDREYYNKVDDLVSGLTNRLKELCEHQHAVPTKPSNQRAVFLAEATDDVEPERDELLRTLTMHGFRVLPEAPLPTGSLDECRSAINSLLSESVIFAQIIGKYPGKRLPAADQRLVCFQAEQAQAAGLPVLHWSGVDVASISDQELLALANRPEVLRTPLEIFKTMLCEQANPPAAAKESSRPTDLSSDVPYVFINSAAEDQPTARQLLATLRQLGCATAIPMVTADPGEIREELEEQIAECDGLIVLYGQVTPRWVRQQLRQLPRLLRKRQLPLRALATIHAPPPDKIDVDAEYPGMLLVDCRNGLVEDRLQSFVANLREANA